MKLQTVLVLLLVKFSHQQQFGQDQNGQFIQSSQFYYSGNNQDNNNNQMSSNQVMRDPIGSTQIPFTNYQNMPSSTQAPYGNYQNMQSSTQAPYGNYQNMQSSTQGPYGNNQNMPSSTPYPSYSTASNAGMTTSFPTLVYRDDTQNMPMSGNNQNSQQQYNNNQYQQQQQQNQNSGSQYGQYGQTYQQNNQNQQYGQQSGQVYQQNNQNQQYGQQSGQNYQQTNQNQQYGQQNPASPQYDQNQFGQSVNSNQPSYNQVQNGQYGYNQQNSNGLPSMNTQYQDPSNQQGNNNYSAISGPAVMNGQTAVNINQYTFTNGNCIFQDGYVTENGQRRQATANELQQVQQYRQKWNQYMSDFNSYMGQWMNNLFSSLPFGNGQAFPGSPTMPQVPPAPCLCSSQSCGQNGGQINTPQMDYQNAPNYNQGQAYQQNQYNPQL